MKGAGTMWARFNCSSASSCPILTQVGASESHDFSLSNGGMHVNTGGDVDFPVFARTEQSARRDGADVSSLDSRLRLGLLWPPLQHSRLG